MSDKISEADETIEMGAENKRVALLIAALALGPVGAALSTPTR